MYARADDRERLVALGPSVETHLWQGQLPDEVWGKAALTLGPWLIHDGRYHELQALLRRALDELELSIETRMWVSVELAMVLTSFLQHSQALIVLDASPDTADHSTSSRVAYQCVRSWVLLRHGRPREALALIEPCIDTTRRHGLTRSTIKALACAGGVHLALDDPERALSCYREALLLHHRLIQQEDTTSTALRNDMAATLIRMRRYQDAERVYQELIHTSRTHGDGYGLSNAWSNCMLCWLLSGKWAELEEHYDHVRDVFERGPRLHGFSGVLSCIALARCLGPARDGSLLDEAEEFTECEQFVGFRQLLRLVKALLQQDDARDVEFEPSTILVHERVWRALVNSAPLEGLDDADLNSLEHELCKRFLPGKSTVDVFIEADLRAASLDGVTWVDLSRTRTGRKFLNVLMERAPERVTAWDMFQEIWPEVPVHDPSALDRLYSAVYRLKARGLGPLFRYDEEGYRWVGRPIVIERQKPSEAEPC